MYKKKPTSEDSCSYSLVSLGCPKNLVDSERMAGLLEGEGFRFTPDPRQADFVVVNTCGFIGDAREESCDVIAEMIEMKRRGQIQALIVAGCLAEREKEALLARFPEIDQLVGVFARNEIASAAARALATTAARKPVRLAFPPPPSPPLHDLDRLRLTPPHVAFLKIAEGCNRRCSFCSIPLMRGPLASKPLEQILVEAEQLARDGTRELTLVAQDTSSYGIDSHGKPQLAELLRRLDNIESLAWIRLAYLYPQHLTDELIDVVASSEKVVPYLDLPLQHINDDILRRMRRRVDRAATERLLEKLRRRISGLVLRTTMLTGFPGETEAQFQELVDFVQQQRFQRLGAFAFSKEPDTHAAELEGHLPEEVKRSRRDHLLAVQQEITFAWAESQIGQQIEVLIDGYIPDQENAYLGRSHADAPEIDGVVYVTGTDLSPGQIVECEIVAAREYDLIGVVP